MILNIEGVKVICFWDWFHTPAGIYSVCVAVPLALLGGLLIYWFERKDEEHRQSWHD